jgi:hypothetical protein
MSGQPISNSGPTVPETEVIVPIITIQLKYYTDLMFYDNSPREVILTYEVVCYIPPETPPGVQCEVVLVGTANDFFVTPIDPLVFTYQIDTLQFTMEVIVPPDAEAFRNFDILVSGTYDISPGQGGGEVPGIVVEMTIPPFGCIQLRAEPRNNKSPVGHWIEVDITILNQANSEDVVTLDVFKNDQKVKLKLSEEVLTVRKGEIKEVTIAARQRSGLPSTNEFTLRARSSYQGLNATVYCDVAFETTLSSSSVFKGPVAFAVGGSAIILIFAVSLIVIFMFRRKRSKRERGFERS